VNGVSGFAARPTRRPIERASSIKVAVEPTSTWTVQTVGPGRTERLEVSSWLAHHQMAVEESGAVLAKGLHDRWTDRHVGDEMTVHHVHVQPIVSASISRTALASDPKSAARIDGATRSAPKGQRRWKSQRQPIRGGLYLHPLSDVCSKRAPAHHATALMDFALAGRTCPSTSTPSVAPRRTCEFRRVIEPLATSRRWRPTRSR